MRSTWTAVLALLLATAAATADTAVLDKTTTGTPEIKAIEAIRFAPGGVLLLADGKGAQVIAVETGGSAAKAGFMKAVDGIDKEIAGKLGVGVKDMEIIDLAVHPVTNTAYVAVSEKVNRKSVIVTIDGEGKIGEFPLEKVKYAKLALPSEGKSTLSRLTDMVWTGDRLLVAGQANEEFGSKLFSIPGPLSHEAKAAVYSTETYHVQHGKWETKAPMTTLMSFVEENKKYVAGAFACTPVVKYPLDDLKAGEKVKGISMVELGSGNRPLNMFMYEKGGKGYILLNTFRMFNPKAFGPSPYLTFRIDQSMMSDKEKVNEKAVRRLDRQNKPATDSIKLVETFHGVRHMDRLGEDRALTIREGDKGGLSLVAIELP